MADNQLRGTEVQDCPAIRVTQNAGCPSIRIRITGGGGGGYKFTGHADVEGLTALGWDAQDIAFLQANVWWNEEEDNYWKVTPANLAFGPNGATPLTWSNRAAQKTNPDIRFYPKLDTPTGTSWTDLFNGYNNVYAIPTHGWDASSVTSFYGVFQNCTLLTAIDLSGWDVSSVTNFYAMFLNCTFLKSVGDLSGWDTGAATNMSAMFSSCSSLEILDLSRWDVSKVQNFVQMFLSCTFLKSVGDLSGWDTGAATNMSSMFNNTPALSTLGDISGWDMGNMSSLSRMFSSTPHFIKLDFYGWDTSSVTDVGAEANSTMITSANLRTLVLGPKFFNFSPSIFYLTQCSALTRDSIYESLYTNQTLRDSSSPAKTVALAAAVYDTLSVQDINDIATKNITLTRN